LLTILFFVSIALYAIILLFFTLGLFKRDRNHSKDQPFVTVVIPVKNEKDHISRILTEVTRQTYPKAYYEVVVVDDESTDITPNVCHAFVEKHSNVRFMSTKGSSSTLRTKKRPLDMGIRQAKGEIILLTDADCHVSSSWIETMISYFTPQVGLVIGYAQTEPTETNLHKIQALDFLLLMGAARGTTQWGLPFACTGQNLAYRKEAFEKVGGFSSFADTVGGDDNLLLQRIKHFTPWKIVFATHSFSYVSSPPVPTLKGFITQRIRWATDALFIRKYNPLFFSMTVTTFLVNLLPLIMLGSSLWSPGLLNPLIIGLIVKFAIEGILMLRTTVVFNRSDLRVTFPYWFILQIPYVTIMGVFSFVGNRMPWGGRQT